MRKSCFFILLIFGLLACRQTVKGPTLPSNVKKVSILEVNGWGPNYEFINDSVVLADPNYMVIMGLLEMDKNFRMKATKRLSFYGDYYYGEAYAARWLRNTVLQLIDSFPSDSILTWNDIQPQIYDAHYYMVLIEKEDGSITRLSGRPFSISEETSELSWFFCDSVETFIKKNKTIANQDSIRKVLRGYEKYVSEFNMYPPLPENVIIKFTPPSISDNF